MRTLRMEIELTYDDDVMHGDDAESILWFYRGLCGPDFELMLHSNYIGDTVGDVRVIAIKSGDAALACAERAGGKVERLRRQRDRLMANRDLWRTKAHDNRAEANRILRMCDRIVGQRGDALARAASAEAERDALRIALLEACGLICETAYSCPSDTLDWEHPRGCIDACDKGAPVECWEMYLLSKARAGKDAPDA